MKILINDHAGHPFQVQLSRTLAGRGHEVLHTYCSSVLQPRGMLTRREGDPDGFKVLPISISSEFNRYGLVSRWEQEKELGQELVAAALEFGPDIVVSANTPLRAQAALIRMCRKKKAKFVFWVQDILGIGIGRAVKKRIPLVGSVAGVFFERYEQRLWKQSDDIVVITEDFLPYLPSGILDSGRVSVIENWSPLDELPRRPKSNSWSREHGLEDTFCLLYSGTLGMKHNPELLLRLAESLKTRDDICLVVITEGMGADFLREEKAKNSLENMILMDFQPYEALPNVLASADVLLAILEPDAGVFAVPSKVLTYLCAGRPLLLAVPPENLAARIVTKNRAGTVVHPSEESAYIEAAMRLIEDAELRKTFAANGLAYAQENFDIEKITDKFEKIILN